MAHDINNLHMSLADTAPIKVSCKHRATYSRMIKHLYNFAAPAIRALMYLCDS